MYQIINSRSTKNTFFSSKNGYSDYENWFKSEMSWGTGRSIVTFEAHALIEYAKNDKIYDLEIANYKIKEK